MRSNIHNYEYKVNRRTREKTNKHRSLVIWLTGLSGSGKTTLADLLEVELNKRGMQTYTLDGDNIRNGISSDLDFNVKGRSENIRRVGEITALFKDAGIVVLAAFITPYEKDRELVKEIVGRNDFVEIYVNASLEICEQRDPKGLYKKARIGEIQNFTGISSRYEVPKEPDIEINTENLSKQEALQVLLSQILPKFEMSPENQS